MKDAFHEVARAREDREKLINQARGYREDLIPKARGEAQEIIRAAEAYKEERILKARGDAARFDSVLAEYRKGPRVTRQRLHAPPDVRDRRGVRIVPPVAAVHEELVFVPTRLQGQRDRPRIELCLVCHLEGRHIPAVEVTGHRHRLRPRTSKPEAHRPFHGESSSLLAHGVLGDENQGAPHADRGGMVEPPAYCLTETRMVAVSSR